MNININNKIKSYNRRYINNISQPNGGTFISWKGITPQINSNVFIACNSVLIGDVRISNESSIWFNCVLRGDVSHIKIGKNTNIQDGTVIHCNSERRDINRPEQPTIIGNGVTIGHSCLLHACMINDYSFIGMNSCIMDEAIIESESFIGAGSLVTNGKIVKSGELWMGRPAKFIRKLSKQEIDEIYISAKNYTKFAQMYLGIIPQE